MKLLLNPATVAATSWIWSMEKNHNESQLPPSMTRTSQNAQGEILFVELFFFLRISLIVNLFLEKWLQVTNAYKGANIVCLAQEKGPHRPSTICRTRLGSWDLCQHGRYAEGLPAESPERGRPPLLPSLESRRGRPSKAEERHEKYLLKSMFLFLNRNNFIYV